MKRFFKENVLLKVFSFLLGTLFISFSFPSPPLTNIVMVLLVVISFLFANQNFREVSLVSILFIAFTLASLVSSFLFDEKLFTNQTTKVFYFLIIPLIFESKKLLKAVNTRTVLNYFIYAVCIFSFLGLIKVLLAFYLDLESKISYQSFSQYLKIHSTYFALLTTLAFCFSVNFSLRIKNSLGEKIKYFLISTYLIFILCLLAVRIAFISSLLLMLIILIRELLINKNKLGFVYIGLLFFSSFFIISDFGYSSIRIKNLFINNQADRSDTENRIVLWKNAYCAIENSPSQILGAGLSNSQELLNMCYEESKFFGLESEYNTHNQFLQTWLETGYLGLLLFFSILFYLAYQAFRKNNYLLLLTLIIFVLFFSTESILERQLGITVFLSFSLLFLKKNPSLS